MVTGITIVGVGCRIRYLQFQVEILDRNKKLRISCDQFTDFRSHYIHINHAALSSLFRESLEVRLLRAQTHQLRDKSTGPLLDGLHGRGMPSNFRYNDIRDFLDRKQPTENIASRKLERICKPHGLILENDSCQTLYLLY